ncbi:MAG: RlmF-related methyltransferase, partial [Flavobacteriales bacterium]
IGTGANCVFPIIGVNEYDWTFVASETDKVALDVAQKIINNNESLKSKVELRHQEKGTQVFKTIIRGEEKYELSICNPPFHSSAQEAMKGSARKVSNLKGKKVKVPVLNFGGQSNELWCEGGEVAFIKNMILESKKYRDSCLWFTTLVAKQKHMKSIEDALSSAGVAETKTIPMGQGNKASRIVAWTFFPFEQRKNWKKNVEAAKKSEEEIENPAIDKDNVVQSAPKKKAVAKAKAETATEEVETAKPDVKAKATPKKKAAEKPKTEPVNKEVKKDKPVAKAKAKKEDSVEAVVETKTEESASEVKPKVAEEAKLEGLRKRAKGKIISRSRKSD